MIGVVVPAHNEKAHIGDCLRSLHTASQCAAVHGEAVLIVVVLDSCSDATGDVAAALGVTTVAIGARNVGAARAHGAAAALLAGARWLCLTDAGTVVAPDWVAAQLAQGCDAVCGTVTVDGWLGYTATTRAAYEAHDTDADGHRHIHGANLGVSSHAYSRVGGFPHHRCSEDVALVHALQADGATIPWSAALHVVTSARRSFRAAGGFGATLARFEQVAPGHRTAAMAAMP